MKTEYYLGQIKRYEYMVEDKLEEIERLRAMCTSLSVPTDKDNIKKSSSQDKLAEAVAKIVDLQSETNNLVDELIKQRCRIINQIDALGETKEYRFLTNRYVLGMKMKDIMAKMGYSVDGLNTLRKKSLKTFEKYYGNEYKNL